jgi:general secretion pathway protein C
MNAIKKLSFYILGIVFAFFIWSVAELFLPHVPPLFVPIQKSYLFFKINLNRIFTPSSNYTPQTQNTLKSLNNYTLKAVFNNSKKGFVILEKNNKTYFVDLNKSIDGYKLIKINQLSAEFIKNGKKYVLTFKKIKTPNYSTMQDNEPKTISKNTLEEYKKNLSKVWKEIGIIKTKNGYLITYIKPNSIFEKMGLKKGDYILEINDIPLRSDEDAWRAYNTIDKFNEVNLKIKRNYNIKVLRYEIN